MTESNESAKRLPSEERKKDLLTERRGSSFNQQGAPGLRASKTSPDTKVVGKVVNEETSGVPMYSYTPCGTP